MGLVIVLAGIPASGKSTVLKETLKILPELQVINHGDIMLQEASSQQIDRDTLRKLPLKQQQQIGIDAIKKITAKLSPLVCLDTHALVKTPFGYCPGVPEAIIRLLNPNAITMVECDPSIIYSRRESDKSRKRDPESVGEIEYHQQISRSFLIACTAINGALFSSIKNQDDPKLAAAQLAELIKSIRN